MAFSAIGVLFVLNSAFVQFLYLVPLQFAGDIMVISLCFLCRTFCELWQPSSNHCGFSRSFEQALQPLLGCVPAAWKWSAELTKAPLALPTSAQSRPHQKRYCRCSSGRRGQTPCCVTSDGDVCTALRVKSIHDTLEVCTLFHFPSRVWVFCHEREQSRKFWKQDS